MADQPERQQPGRPVAIPDGGLGAALPDWMQEKPEWSDRDESVVSTLIRDRPVPNPDTSPILLADIVTIDDLPGWLRDVARRPAADAPVSADGDVATGQAEPDLTSEPAAPVTTFTPGRSDTNGSEHPWWASDRAMAGLLIAVIITLFFVLITAVRMM